MPVPTEELPILERLVNIRDRLTALKSREGYVSPQAVFDIYQSILEQVQTLDDVREQAPTSQEEQPNRVDDLLSDVFQLLSLFFLTIGKSKEAPATYCQLATMDRLLDHLVESAVYTASDLKSFQNRLTELKNIITTPTSPTDGVVIAAPAPSTVRVEKAANEPEAMKRLLLKKYAKCQNTLDKLLSGLEHLDSSLVATHQRLVTIRRTLAGIAARPKPTLNEATHLKEELRAIDSKRVDGKFMGPKGDVPPGQALLIGLLEENFDLLQDIMARQEDVAIPLKPIYDRLLEMKSQLERLALTHRWTLRETDLYNFQMSLAEIDSMRVGGHFVDSEGKKPEGQIVLLYLLRRCFGLIYRLMASSEPISEELMPIANKLSTIKRCLKEIQKHGDDYSKRELYPYYLALSQIDELRVDGKFLGHDGSIPEGQAIVSAELAEAYEIIKLLAEEIDHAEEEKE